jgi:hypothetical protein
VATTTGVGSIEWFVAITASMGFAEGYAETSNLGYFLMVCGNNQLSGFYRMV